MCGTPGPRTQARLEWESGSEILVVLGHADMVAGIDEPASEYHRVEPGCVDVVAHRRRTVGNRDRVQRGRVVTPPREVDRQCGRVEVRQQRLPAPAVESGTVDENDWGH